MARFSSAARALRGPFRKLIQKLEPVLRKPVVRRLGPVGRRAAKYFRAQDARLALHRARAEASAARSAMSKRRLPRATTVAVDRTTGRVAGVGFSGENVTIAPEVLARLPRPKREYWVPENCGEAVAATRALSDGSRLEDLVYRSVKTKTGEVLEACANCVAWIPKEI